MRPFARFSLLTCLAALLASCGGGASSPSESSSSSPEKSSSSSSQSQQSQSSSQSAESSQGSQISSSSEKSESSSKEIEPSSEESSESSSPELVAHSFALSFEDKTTSFQLIDGATLKPGAIAVYGIRSFKANSNAPFSLLKDNESFDFSLALGTNAHVTNDHYYFIEGGTVNLFLHRYEEEQYLLEVSYPEATYNVFVDGTVSFLEANPTPMEEEGKLFEYCVKGVSLEKGSLISFTKNDVALDVAIDEGSNNNVRLSEGDLCIRTAAEEADIYLKFYEGNIYKVYVTGYQGKEAEILAASFKAFAGESSFDLAKNEYAVGEGLIAEFMVERVTYYKGDILHFEMDGKRIDVIPEVSDTNNWRPNINGDLAINNSCIKCGEIYLKAYEDRFEAWVFGYIPPEEPITGYTYSLECKGLEEGALTDGSTYFAKVTQGDEHFYLSATYKDYYYYERLEFTVVAPLASFYVLRCPAGTTLADVMETQGMVATQVSQESTCIENIFNYVVQW